MTTVLTDAAIEVAGRRLNPAISPEWQHLLTHFELSEGFSFIVLLVPDADWADACRIALARYLEAEGKNLLTVSYSDAEDFKVQVPGRLLELHTNKQTGAVWLAATVSEASQQYDEWTAAWQGMATRLNQFRNPLRRQFDVPLVFVGAHWIQPVIREIAPDLWSVRTMVTRLEPPSESAAVAALETANVRQLEGVAIDPDFALQTAQRLRGQEGKELALAQLLYRAGLGLNARYRRREAEAVLREAIDLQRQFKAPPPTLAASLRDLGFGLQWQCDYEQANSVLNEARRLYGQDGDEWGEASCIGGLGDIALQRSDHAMAQAHFEEARQIYRRVGSVLGEASCISGVGDIALRRSDLTSAQGCFEEALALYRGIGNAVGEANCLTSLGTIALRRSDHATAQGRYEDALMLYRSGGNVVGEANCIASLGDIARGRLDDVKAQGHYEEALPLYRRAGSVLGEANCIQSLGDIAFFRSDYTTAQARYEEALPLYRRVGDVLGEAHSIKNRGDVAWAQGRMAEARALLQQALALYQRISDPYSVGQAHRRLARLAENSEERDEHLDAARQAWESIDRPDLIKNLDEEFDTNGGQ